MRGRFWITAAAAVCMMAASAESYAQYQQAPVTISKEKVRMGGKVYYSHIVLEKQTLYSISKAYGVSIDDILDANPALKESGLKKNAIILIPESSADAAAAPRREDDATQAAGERSHEAADMETAVAAPAQDGGKEADADDVDRPKKDRKKKKGTAGKDDDVFVTHTVRWYEDLDVISEKYGVPVDIIMKVNGLTGRKLTNRQKLKIPADLEAYLIRHPESAASRQEQETAPAADTTGENISSDPKPQETPVSKTVKAMLMLPLNTGTGMTGSENNMDFYCGVLLAARDLGLNGTDIELCTYDISGGSARAVNEAASGCDFIIGPISTGDLREVLTGVPSSIPVISPIDPRAEVLAKGHVNFIQTPASTLAQYADLVSWMNEEAGPEDRIVVIYEKGMRETPETAAVDSLMQKSGRTWSSFSYSILEGRNVLSSLESLMNPASVNRVLIVSESEAFVNDVVRNLKLMIHDKYGIVLYGPSRTRGFETLDVDDLHAVNLHVSLSYYVDYDSPEVQEFLLKYRALFNTEPGAFAFQGYDIMTYFVRMRTRYGKDWTDRLSETGTERMLQSDFRFRRKGEGGLENSGIRRVVYGSGYSVTQQK